MTAYAFGSSNQWQLSSIPELRIKLGDSGLTTEVWVGRTQVMFIASLELAVGSTGVTKLKVTWAFDDAEVIYDPTIRMDWNRARALMEPFLSLPEPPRPVCPTAWEHLTKDDPEPEPV